LKILSGKNYPNSIVGGLKRRDKASAEPVTLDMRRDVKDYIEFIEKNYGCLIPNERKEDFAR
jgi:hypothetical protein